ncbi:MAG: tetraacyldisaccharide 4'-kinase [Methylophaga sp.]|nr:tetraacyldisaccharide 4'-kinase [Methylophaga sp.]
MQWLSERWYRRSLLAMLLWPLSQLYRGLLFLRRSGYQAGLIQQKSLPVPVIIVGNINVGGTGKSPFVIWLTRQLHESGYRPGIISRGYGGAGPFPFAVQTTSQPEQCGDEPLMIHQHTGYPVVVDPDRFRAGQYLLANQSCDVIIADDGLQHYRLARDIEIVVIDGERMFGNNFLLPAGPLREPVDRLRTVDFLVCNSGNYPSAFRMDLKASTAINLLSGAHKPLTSFAEQPLHAVAGIGHPQRFFQMLREAGLSFEEHSFADHHAYQPSDLTFSDSSPILMTEKDAVKCRSFATTNMWYLPIEADLPALLKDNICEKLRNLNHG